MDGRYPATRLCARRAEPRHRRGACRARAASVHPLSGTRQRQAAQEELARERITPPARATIAGKPIGGGAFTRGQLYHLLGNVIYTGRIGHKDKTYPGLHQPIIDEETFAAAQALLASHRQGHGIRVRATHPSLLAGRIIDADGNPLVASHANKGKVRHRYYVSRALNEAKSSTGMRLPAREIESLVTERLVELVADPIELVAIAWLEVPPHEIEELHWRCKELEARLRLRHSPDLRAIVQQVRVGSTDIAITCDIDALAAALRVARTAEAPSTMTLNAAARLTRSGRALRLVQANGCAPTATPDRSLVRLLIQARRWWGVLKLGEISPTELAAREGVTRPYIARVVRLAFLSPAVTPAILSGRQRAGVTVASLRHESSVLLSWRAQRIAMLPTGIDV